jgi:hypothetical protein
MRGKAFSIGLKATFAILTLAIFPLTLFVTEASAGTLKILHNFNGQDGDDPLQRGLRLRRQSLRRGGNRWRRAVRRIGLRRVVRVVAERRQELDGDRFVQV